MMDGLNEVSGTKASAWKEEPWSIPDFLFISRTRFMRALKQHPIATTSIVVAVMFLAITFRHDAQQLLLIVRIYSGGLSVALLVATGFWFLLKRFSARWRALSGVIAAVVLAIIFVGGRSAHEYVAQYFRYETLTNVADLTELPISVHERVLPLRAVHTLARDRMNGPQIPSPPDLIRMGKSICWMMAILPNKFVGKLSYAIDQVQCVPATDPSPDFGGNMQPVHFSTGENFYLGRNIDTCVRRTFGLWRTFTYDVDNVIIMPGESGQMVQVVSLTKWTGFLFPWPEPGGVQVIPQTKPESWYKELFWENPMRFLFGCGEWIPPEEVSKHAFLQRQNIVPDAVARFTAESFRFQGGTNWFDRFWAPMPWSRQGDIAIADIPEDMNQQPFVLFFKMGPNDEGKLYKYFALETRDPETHGLSTSVWYPADGQGPIGVYRHAARGEHLLGVTAIRDRVMASRRDYKWGENTVAEARPYIHPIADADGVIKPRFEYMTTLVTFTKKQEKEGGEVRLMPGGAPEISLTDASRERVVWVDTFHPDKWDEQLQAELSSLWAQQK